MPSASPNPCGLVRAYTSSDRSGCITLFDSNVPHFFAETERNGFVEFLDHQAAAWSYQVIERNSCVVACGGHALEPDGVTASLCWGMVERELQGSGLGSLLTVRRSQIIGAIPGVSRVRLDTSQHTRGFYERFGFSAEAIVPDGYGPGLDRWDMFLRLR